MGIWIKRLASVWLALVASLQVVSVCRAQAPAWIEPRALNIVDIAGRVPDQALAGHIIAYGQNGLSQFISSDLDGATLRITVRFYPRWDSTWKKSRLPLLGKMASMDFMASVAPASWLRLYENGTDITGQSRPTAEYYEPALISAQTSAAAWIRYPGQWRTLVNYPYHLATGIALPANWGGNVKLWNDRPELTGVFTVVVDEYAPRVTYLGMQQETFRSYVGVGAVGYLQPLMDQMRSRYRDRHPRIMLNIPAGANYVLFNYPPMPFDVSTPTGMDNLFRPSGGTVRLAPDSTRLSQDLVHGGAFPLLTAWQDADQSPGPYLSRLTSIDRATPPEYVVLPGTAYNPLFPQRDLQRGRAGEHLQCHQCHKDRLPQGRARLL